MCPPASATMFVCDGEGAGEGEGEGERERRESREREGERGGTGEGTGEGKRKRKGGRKGGREGGTEGGRERERKRKREGEEIKVTEYGVVLMMPYGSDGNTDNTRKCVWFADQLSRGNKCAHMLVSLEMSATNSRDI